MFYHFLAPEGGHPTLEEDFIEKIPKCKVIYLSRTSKINQQKQIFCFQKCSKYIPVL